LPGRSQVVTLQAEGAELSLCWVLVAGSSLSSGHLARTGARAVVCMLPSFLINEVSGNLGKSMHLACLSPASQAARQACGGILAFGKVERRGAGFQHFRLEGCFSSALRCVLQAPKSCARTPGMWAGW